MGHSIKRFILPPSIISRSLRVWFGVWSGTRTPIDRLRASESMVIGPRTMPPRTRGDASRSAGGRHCTVLLDGNGSRRLLCAGRAPRPGRAGLPRAIAQGDLYARARDSRGAEGLL